MKQVRTRCFALVTTVLLCLSVPGEAAAHKILSGHTSTGTVQLAYDAAPQALRSMHGQGPDLPLCC